MRIWGRVTILVVAAALAAGCGDDDDSEGGVDGGAASPSTTDDGESLPAAEDGPDECATAAEAEAPAMALEAFPDNPDVTWEVLGATIDDEGRSLVELQPDPDEVGYPRFTFLIDCTTGEPVRLATYAFEDEGYILLATTDAAGDSELQPELGG